MPRKLKSALKSIRAALRSNKYHNKYRKIISSGCSLKDIEVLSIEFCSICNLKCRYCYLEEGQRPPFLDMNIYDKLLSEICKNEEYRIKIMEWPISGCFFLHPKHGEIITMTGEYRKRFPHFRPWIILNDNMTMFGADRIDFVLKTNIINQIICSIDGVDKETFEYMRPGADYGRVLENTASLLRITRQRNSSMVIQINNGRDENCRGKKRDSRLRGIFEQANLVTEWEPVDWNESFHRGNPCYKPYPSFCSFVFESVSLSTSGAIIKCCMDLKESTAYGDFRESTLQDIWLSEKRREFLSAMREGKRRLIPGCGTCSINYVRQNKYP